eukprot:9471594-Pyramimonas_sp.AAC.1
MPAWQGDAGPRRPLLTMDVPQGNLAKAIYKAVANRLSDTGARAHDDQQPAAQLTLARAIFGLRSGKRWEAVGRGRRT